MFDFHYNLAFHLTALVPRLGARVHRAGFENVPAEGPALLLCNHISHFDPPLMAMGFPRVIHFMADKPLLEIPVLGGMLRRAHVFPIDRTKNDRNALRTAMARLEAGNIVAIFPEKGIRQGKTSVLGGAELAIGTASLWRMMNVPVIPMVIIGSDQLYSWKNFFPRSRVFVRVGPMLPADPGATKEEARDRIVKAWRDLFAAMKREYNILPGEFPQTAQERWGQPVPEAQVP